MRLPRRVTVCEVGPRDGLQTVARLISTPDKVRLIDALAGAGLPVVEATAFVNPRVVPQMADAARVLAAITRRPGTRYRALVLNQKGVELALQSQVDAVIFVVCASETFNRKNVRMSVDEGLAQAEAAAARCREAGMGFVMGIGTAFGCPYEGEVPLTRVQQMVGRLVAAGVQAIALADTTGMAHPAQVYAACAAIRDRWPDLALSLHFHNTRGQGLANVLAGLQAGVTEYDAAIGGLGGCPFAPRASGNICTVDLVHLLQEMGVETGANVEALMAVAQLAEELVGYPLPGQVMKAGPAKQLYPA